MAQEPEYKKITFKEAKLLINEYKGIEDVNFKKKYFNTAFRLNTGKAVLWFDTHSFIYNSFQNIIDHIESLNKRENETPVSNILKDKLLYKKEFESYENELISEAIETFELENSEPSMEGVKKMDDFINSTKILINASLYSQILAYVGRVMINNLPDAKWQITQRNVDKSIYEPYIVSKKKLYNPFFFTYKELYENLSEKGKVDLYNSMIIEMGKLNP
jgi:hypothetical protein